MSQWHSIDALHNNEKINQGNSAYHVFQISIVKLSILKMLRFNIYINQKEKQG